MASAFCQMIVGSTMMASGATASRLAAQAHKANLKGARSYAVTPLGGGTINVRRVA